MIFVCGVSGSGKSHVISLVTDADAHFIHVKGSEILSECNRPIRNLNQADAEKNQAVLHSELLRRHFISPRHILDGHMTIEIDGGLFIIPDFFFETISVQRMICIFDDPSKIAGRLEKKGVPTSRIAIELHQQIERREARARADLLGCPYHEFAASDLDGFARTLET